MPVTIKAECPRCNYSQDVMAVTYQCDMVFECRCGRCGLLFDDESEIGGINHPSWQPELDLSSKDVQLLL